MRKVFYILPLLFLSVISFAQPGTPDNTFNGTGRSLAPVGPGVDQAYGMAIQPDGAIVVVGISHNGTDFDMAVARYTAAGILDPTFSGDGMLTQAVGTGDDIALSVAIQADGKIVVSGFANNGGNTDIVVLRFLSNGTLDNGVGGFGPTNNGIVTTDIAGDDMGNTVAIQPDGKIVVGGNSGTSFAVVRYDATGIPDPTFSGDGIATVSVGGIPDYGFGLAIQPDGKILLSGFDGINGPFGDGTDIAVVRFDAVGVLDIATFGGGNGFVTTDIGTGTNDRSRGTNIALQTDGSFYVTGATSTAPSTSDFVTVYYNSDGSLNGTFGGTGKVVENIDPGRDEAFSVLIQNDNKIVIAGSSDNGEFVVVRYLPTGIKDITYDGDGISQTNIVGIDFSFTAKLGRFNIYVAGATQVGVSNQDFAVLSLQNDASPLPLNLLSFTAQKQNSEIALNWKTEKEVGITQFVVERSSDGRNFSSIGSLTPSKLSALVSSYSFSDKQPLQSVNYYRLAIKQLDESIIHSKVVAIKFNKKIQDLEIFPNPAVDNSVRMQLPDGLKGHISLQIVDATGRLMKTASYESQGGSSIATTLDVSSLQKGVYFISIKTTNNGTITKRFIKN
jgi:uncharacterized delta-60 repeat protein